MNQNQLSKPSSSNEGTESGRPSSEEKVTVPSSDPPPVAKKSTPRRFHLCLRCDDPIIAYGRLLPCTHVFCFNCSSSDPLCYLCEAPIEEIQKISVIGGIYICAAPYCHKSFWEKSEIRSHAYEMHQDLLPKRNESEEAVSGTKPSETRN